MQETWSEKGAPVIVSEAWCVEHCAQGAWGPVVPRYVEFVQIGFNRAEPKPADAGAGVKSGSDAELDLGNSVVFFVHLADMIRT